MKKITLGIIFCINTLFVISNDTDTTYWKINLKSGITFNQASFSDNWKSGGNNSISGSGLFFGKTSYQKDKFSWVTQIDLQYGRIKNEGEDTRKSVDKMVFDSKLGHKLNKNWNAFSSINFLSQFDNGFIYPDEGEPLPISGFFAPAFITSSWGAEYKPNELFNARLSPFSPRITIVKDTTLYHNVPENYGVKPKETIRYEWKAFRITAGYENSIVENVSIKADYELFANLDKIKMKKIDHRLDLILTAKIYKFLNLTVTNNYIYDIDQDKKIQSSILIGLSFLLNYEN